MVGHGSSALLLLRFFLPASLLFATCLVFTIPSLVFFVAFLVLHFRPRYEVTKLNFPSVYLIFLLSYSALLVIAHIVLAILTANNVGSLAKTSRSSLAQALAIPNYEHSAWMSVKLLLSPVAVLVFSVLTLFSSTPDGEQRYFSVGKRKASRGAGTGDTTTTETSHQDAILDSPTQPVETLDSHPAPISKFTKHMSGRGGIFWTTIACGLTGLSYSSLLTVVFLALFAFVVVVWAFCISNLYPRELKGRCVVAVKAFRIFVLLYLVFLVSLQNKWFVDFVSGEEPQSGDTFSNVLRFIGFVVLDTSESEGWAYVTGFCGAVATYVFSGIFVYSLIDVLAAQAEENALDAQELGSSRNESLGYSLSYYETQFLHTVLHLSSLGLLIWSLVFPGVLTLPMMFCALAYFASKEVRHASIFDRIIVYAILLQIAHFLFLGVTSAFNIPSKSKTIVLLGLRSFKPQFSMNLVQALALALFCTNIFCKRYIRSAVKESNRRNGHNLPLGLRDFLRRAEFSATAKKQRTVYATLKVILDQFALASLYIAAATKASVLNSFFIVALCVLCLCQAFGMSRRQKVMRFLWTVVLAYTTAFLLVTCTVCRAIKAYEKHCKLDVAGVLPASSWEVVAYTSTIVFSAVQVHFTWSDAQIGSSDAAYLEGFRSTFWTVTRKYFLIATYISLLMYPLVFPANFLSYGYVLFLAISVLVELLGPIFWRSHSSVRPLIRRYWPTVVIFSVGAVLSRYIYRFPVFSSGFASKWIFGFDRLTISRIQFTLGDASMLIIVSLQGRLFGIDKLMESVKGEQTQRESGASENQEMGIAGLDLPSNRNASTEPLITTPGLGQPSLPAQSLDRGSLIATEGGRQLDLGMSSRAEMIPQSESVQRSLYHRPSNLLRTFGTSRYSTIDDGIGSRKGAPMDRERLNQFAQRIRNWRKSLPVKQTEKFVNSAYDYTLAIVRSTLLQYSYVLEACAILAAAVWLPGFSVFGGIYSILGCVLLLAEQASVNVVGHMRNINMGSKLEFSQSEMRMTKILPIVLSILSFALMSGQYMYSIIAEIHDTGPNYVLSYVGFQKSALTPIDQKAMLAHVLVFVTAFLQRVAVTWAAKDALKINEEEKQAEEFGNILPGPLQSQEELAGAVRIGDVLSGVGEFSLPPPQIPLELTRQSNIQEKSKPVAQPSSPGKTPALDQLGLKQSGPPPSIFSSQVEGFDMPNLEELITRSESVASTQEEADASKGSSASGKLAKALQLLRRCVSELNTLVWDVISLLSPFWEKWGFDVTFMYLVIGGAFTRTFFSVIYIALVMAVSGFRRARIARHWHHITLLLATLVLLQYFLSLGIPQTPRNVQVNPQQKWLEWLYLDWGNKKLERKFDVTFAFLAVICASMTLNAVSPGARGVSYWFRKSLPLPVDPEYSSETEDQKMSRETTGQLDVSTDADAVQETLPKVHPDFSFVRGNKSRNTTGNGITEDRIEPMETLESAQTEGQSQQVEGKMADVLFSRVSRDKDFTQRPMSLKNQIKLSWMRGVGALVQLYMFGAAVVVTSVLSGILLLLSFYFMFQFTNVNLKKSKFFIVRFYVLSIVFVLVAFQAPFESPGKWVETIGLFKTSDGRTGLIFLYLMVSVWLLCQMQGRIYESSSFKYVVKFGEEDAKVRFKRAVHEHNARKYEHMLGRNKNKRARLAREGRLERLKKLKSTTDRSLDALYKVCVLDEMKVLRAKVDLRKSKDHIFGSHIKTRKEMEEKKTDESKLRIFIRFLFRGRSWRKYLSHPLTSELRVFVSRYSGLSVYFTMLLAAVVNPNELTALYQLGLFLYLILEQPRPPKQVWQFLMFYVSFIITGKYIVREVANCKNFFFLPRVGSEGLCEIGAGIFFEILILLSLLWHRTVLYYRGLWDLESSEEDMLLSNEIHGTRVETPAELVMTELPPLDEEEPLLLPTTSGGFFSKDEQPRRRTSLMFASADQQCSDVTEVLNRARESIVSLAREAEQRESFPSTTSVVRNPSMFSEKKPMLDLSSVWRGKNSLTPSFGPQTSVGSLLGTPRSSAQFADRPDELSRFGSLRFPSRLRAQDPLEAAKHLTASQSRVHKSLLQWKVIPPGKLSLFDSTGKKGFYAGFMNHFTKLTKKQEHKAVGDYYIVIFLVDFISFVFVTFGFSSIFIEGVDAKPWWTVNFIEIRHLLTLIAMFCALVMDRVVYLTRSMRGKLFLQYSSVIVYHVVIFYIQRNIRVRFVTKAFYMLRCLYFLLSGLQIRSGFPTYTTAQFLLRNYNTPGIIMFEIYMFVPFLWLMRTLLDWAVVPTSLEIFQYFRFVDIYIWLYRNRAVNRARGMFQRKLGQQRRWLPRVYQGFGIFLLCAIALFAPFLFFSVVNPFTVKRAPAKATLSVDLLVPAANQDNKSNVQTAYTVFSRTAVVGESLTKGQISAVNKQLGIEIPQRDGRLNFLSDFGVISDEQWNLPSQAELELRNSLDMSSRGNQSSSFLYQVSATTDSEEFIMREAVKLSRSHVVRLSESLSSRADIALKLNTTFPVYGTLDAGSTTFTKNDTAQARIVCVRHSYGSGSDGGSFWSMESCRQSNCSCSPSVVPTERNMFVMEVAVVSGLKVGGSTILTLYGVILFTLANFMRGFFADKRLIIPHIDMPYTLHLYQLVLDIIYARQDQELEMEEILYNGLADIYRDQHVLAKWSGERALKIPTEWWLGSEDEEAYFCYPSFSETVNEPYMTRVVE